MPAFTIATVGDNCIDRYLPPIGQSTVGGNAVNVAVQLRLLGADVAYFGAVGDDAAGQRMRLALAEKGVNLDRLRIRPGITAYTDLDVDDSGDRIITLEDFGACRGYRPDVAEIELLCRMKHVHLGWLDDGGALKRHLVAAGISVSQDLAVTGGAAAGGATGLAVAFASAGADLDRAKKLLAQALTDGAHLAVVTCGAFGSIAGDGRMTVATGIAPTEVVDTTGAGDTFIAGYLDAHLQGHDLHACLEAGRDAAAVTCRHLGGFPQQPLSITD